jgi:pyochelin synthetase
VKHDPTAGAAVLRECVADLIGATPEEVDLSLRFAELGVESLGALKLRRALAAKCGNELPLTAFLGDVPAFRVLEFLAAADVATVPDAAPMVPVEAGEPVALTPVQGAYWAGRGADFALGGVATFWYHEYDRPAADVGALESAFARLVAHHPMLRTTIGRDGFQRENAEVPPFRIERTDLREMRTDDAERALAELRHRLSHQVRAPHEWPLFDVHAALLPGGGVRVFVGFDVLILDFASWRLLMTQWGRLVADPDLALPAPPAAFLDIVRHRETDPAYQARRDRDRAYWAGRSLPAGPQLPLADDAGSLAEPRFRRRRRRLDAGHWANLRERAAGHGLSPTSVLLAAFGLVLRRWGATEPFALNATLFDRPEDVPGVHDLVGDFTTTALVAMPAAASFVDYARETNETLWEAIDHRSYTGVEVRRETGHAYPVVFTSGIGIGDGTAPAGWLGEEVFGVSQTPQVLLDHLVWEEDGAVRLVWDAVEAAFGDGYLDGLADAEYTLLTRLAEDDAAWTDTGLGWDPTFAAPELLDVTPFGDCGPLLDAPVRLAAARTPDAPAVMTAGSALSHGALAARAEALAGSLAAAGVSAGDLVLVALPKSAGQIAAVLAVLRCGAGYVPVDPAWPAARIAAVCERAGIAHAVAEDGVPLPSGVTAVGAAGGDGPVVAANPDDLAYVIFTSGSTGVPKGVAIEHRQARTTIDDITDRFSVTAADRVLGLSALSFDLSVYDIFGVLGAGGAMVLPDLARQRDPQHWCELIGAHGVTVWNTAPALLEMVVEYAESDPAAAARLGSLRLAMLSGDWIPVSLPDRLRALVPDARVMSLGGATEASIWSITYPIGEVDPAWPSIPYGRPLRDQGFHILGEDGLPCPVGEPGELFIAGAGVARGYIGDPAQTAERFAVHPVLGERLYRTGDLGRWRTDGTIQFLGRTDRQVKIRGHRIELGEIESALDRLPPVRQAVAAAAPGPDGRPRLVAYVVLAEPCAERALAERLGESVPDYMVPARFVVLDAMPVTDNGKVDHKALPNPFRRTAPTLASTSATTLTPDLAPASRSLSRESDPEEGAPDHFHVKVPVVAGALAEVARGILGDVDFTESLIAAGASSLDVVRLANAIEDTTGTRPSFTELVAHPSIEHLLRAHADTQPPVETPAGLPDPGGLVLAMRLERPEDRTLADALVDAGRWLRDLHDWAGHRGYRLEESILPGGRDLVEVRLRAGDTDTGTDTAGPFPLTEMQLAYLVGRVDTWLGDAVAPHYYTEVDVLDLDPERLEAALRTVVARHPGGALPPRPRPRRGSAAARGRQPAGRPDLAGPLRTRPAVLRRPERGDPRRRAGHRLPRPRPPARAAARDVRPVGHWPRRCPRTVARVLAPRRRHDGGRPGPARPGPGRGQGPLHPAARGNRRGPLAGVVRQRPAPRRHADRTAALRTRRHPARGRRRGPVHPRRDVVRPARRARRRDRRLHLDRAAGRRPRGGQPRRPRPGAAAAAARGSGTRPGARQRGAAGARGAARRAGAAAGRVLQRARQHAHRGRGVRRRVAAAVPLRPHGIRDQPDPARGAGLPGVRGRGSAADQLGRGRRRVPGRLSRRPVRRLRRGGRGDGLGRARSGRPGGARSGVRAGGRGPGCPAAAGRQRGPGGGAADRAGARPPARRAGRGTGPAADVLRAGRDIVDAGAGAPGAVRGAGPAGHRAGPVRPAEPAGARRPPVSGDGRARGGGARGRRAGGGAVPGPGEAGRPPLS